MARKSEEDIKVAKAITAAMQGIGEALFITFREGANPLANGASEKIVKVAWSEAADKIITVMMEGD